MSVRTVAGKFMELCSQGKHFEFMRSFYAPEIVSVEGDGKQNNTFHSQDLRGPFFCGDANASTGRFAVYTAIEFSPKAGGERVKHDEVGLYTVKNDLVTREEFFYDGHFI